MNYFTSKDRTNIYSRVFIWFVFFIFNSIYLKAEECPKEAPILNKEKECLLKYCTKEEYEKEECKINNKIIETQWINNIIEIGHNKSRYPNFASFQNGDFILSINGYPHSQNKILYGLKNNGRPLFNKESSFYYFNEINQSKENEHVFESETEIILLNNKNNNIKEYLISIGKDNNYVEIFDFENEIIYKKLIQNFTENYLISSDSNIFLYLNSNNYNFYYLFGFITNVGNEFKIIFQRHILSSIDNFKSYSTLNKTIIEDEPFSKKERVSCFQTKKNIMCFYLTKDEIYKIIAYYNNLDKIDNFSLNEFLIIMKIFFINPSISKKK